MTRASLLCLISAVLGVPGEGFVTPSASRTTARLSFASASPKGVNIRTAVREEGNVQHVQGGDLATMTSSSSRVARRAFVVSGVAGLASVGLLLAGGSLEGPEPADAAQRVGSGGPPFSKSGYDLSPLTPEEVGSRVDKLTELQKVVLTQAGTERPFQGKTVNGYSGATKAEGTWVSAVSGVPLFSSQTKYDSGTGWPSFYAPIDPDHVIERPDPKDARGLPKFLIRTEVIDKKSGTHLGHVFDDGPRPTGKRYCMNAASMAFIPKEEPLPVKPSYKP